MSAHSGGETPAAPPRDARSSDDPGEELPPIERKVARTGLVLEPGWIYLVDADGDIARFALRGLRLGRCQKVLRLGIQREPSHVYYVDADGDVARARLAH